MLTAIVIGALSALTLPVAAWLGYRSWLPGIATGTVAGFGAGALLGAGAVELLPGAEIRAGLIGALGALLAGAALFTVLNQWIVERLPLPLEGVAARAGSALVLGALVDGVPEALALGMDLSASGTIPLALLTAVAVSNFPEALVGGAALRASGLGSQPALLTWGLVTVLMALLTGLGHAVAQTVSGLAYGMLLGLAAGGIVAVVADTLIPAATRLGGDRAGLAAALGVAFVYLLHRLH